MTQHREAPITDVAGLGQQLEQAEAGHNRLRRFVAGCFLGGAAVAAMAVGSGEASQLVFTQTMPYNEAAQHLVNNLDTALAGVGEVSLPLALGTIGFTKWGAKNNPQLDAADRWSSQDMGASASSLKGRFHRGLRTTFAGRVPVMAAVGVAAAIFSTSLGEEVGNGPQRAADKALSALAPGDAMVVGYEGVMPMVQSNISYDLADNVLRVAKKEHVPGQVLDDDLGQLTTPSGQNLSDLSFGIDEAKIPAGSSLRWNPAEGCNDIPVAVDSIAGVSEGSQVQVNGVNAEVVQELNGVSATNRIGVEMDQQAMATCLHKSPDGKAPVYSVVLDTSVNNARDILHQANADGETSTVISKQTFLDNSRQFWEANVKPLTSVLEIFAGVLAFVAMGSSLRERMIRSRREWAAKSAAGVSDAMIRGTELLRAAKDGVLASAVGIAGATATPFVVNSLESGFRAGIDLKSAMVGCAVGIVGSLAGALRSVVRPQKIINTPENTRM